MECYGAALSEMTYFLAREPSSDHLAKPNSRSMSQSLKVLSTNNPPCQLHLQDGCVRMCMYVCVHVHVPGRQTACVLSSEHACLEMSVHATAIAQAEFFLNIEGALITVGRKIGLFPFQK